jgi:hypothetical protein
MYSTGVAQLVCTSGWSQLQQQIFLEYTLHPTSAKYRSLERSNQDGVPRARIKNTEQDRDPLKVVPLVIQLCHRAFWQKTAFPQIMHYISDSIGK